MSNSKSNSIKAIDKKTINQICSGQVILTLATAVKELLENSLDANATSIQVKLKEHGSECIEVCDNGYGVEEKNFEGLTLKHHTSKIAAFEDLESVETFGFRGEALSSLCALGNVTIITRHIDATYGTSLRFDNNGGIKDSCNVARQVGTTVLIENLFSTLPVRHKEFLRNIKKEFCKLCNVLQAYALLNCHCSFSCVNRIAGKSRLVMETRIGSIRDNISSIFGIKQLSDLVEIKSVVPDSEILSDFHCSSASPTVNLSGFISSCSHGSGRSAADRQFLFINSRPVDNSKVLRLVNEIYHQYNSHQQPLVILNIVLSSDSVDVNVVPDKRQIMIGNENLVLATIKASLQQLFQSAPSTLTLQPAKTAIDSNNTCSETSIITNLSRFNANGVQSQTDCNNIKVKQKPLSEFFQRQVVKCTRPEPSNFPIAKKPKLDSQLYSDHPYQKPSDTQFADSINETLITNPNVSKDSFFKCKIEILANISSSNDIQVLPLGVPNNSYIDDQKSSRELTKNVTIEDCDNGITEEEKNQRTRLTSTVTIEEIRKSRNYPLRVDERKTNVKFFAKIEPSSNERAESELRKQLSQKAFSEMKILGQFNKGFIITKLDSDIFIIDQHATDEKANFEMLSKKGVQSQKLAVPQLLSLTADKEELIQDRCDIIRANGFDFDINLSAPVTHRISLTSVPTLKGITLDRRDLDELLFLLVDSIEGEMCRPSKVRDILASKACRMSVMVGDALNAVQMQRLVRKMAELVQPWNCPHGRPTIRHLISLDLLSNSKVSSMPD